MPARLSGVRGGLLGVVGLLEDVNQAASPGFKEEGDVLVLLGEAREEKPAGALDARGPGGDADLAGRTHRADPSLRDHDRLPGHDALAIHRDDRDPDERHGGGRALAPGKTECAQNEDPRQGRAQHRRHEGLRDAPIVSSGRSGTASGRVRSRCGAGTRWRARRRAAARQSRRCDSARR
ncbi:MAG: hypothetical protein K6V36_15395, partial [Anaerolineae bacterium]|nr:hypothetical protein [Anaerolineae bacterium]